MKLAGTLRDVEKVACPTCHSAPGFTCRTRGFGGDRSPHAKRYERARVDPEVGTTCHGFPLCPGCLYCLPHLTAEQRADTRYGAGRPVSIRACEFCESTDDVREESGRSAYPYDGQRGSPDDPNRRRWLCRACAQDWHAYWDEMRSYVPS